MIWDIRAEAGEPREPAYIARSQSRSRQISSSEPKPEQEPLKIVAVPHSCRILIRLSVPKKYLDFYIDNLRSY